MNKLTIYYGKELASYGFGEDHPFGPDRLDAFWTEACAQGLDTSADIAAPVSAGRHDLELFHEHSYIEKLVNLSRFGSGYLDSGDTPAFPGIYEAACVVSGCVLDGLARIMSGQSERAFIPIAGLHHARRDGAAGFCAVNDIGILVETMRKRYGIRRIAYVDIDAHHGDGVFYAYEEDPQLLFADIHEDGRQLYPGTGLAEETGKGDATGTKLNIPLTPPACTDEDFMQAWTRVEAFVRAAEPEFIILQAGADSLAGDPITHMQYTTAAHTHAARRLSDLADELCDGRLLATGGGGYNRANLAAAWTAVCTEMLT